MNGLKVAFDTYRNARQLTVIELAKMLDIKPNTLSVNINSGKVSVDRIDKICKILGVPKSEFFAQVERVEELRGDNNNG